MIEKKKNKRDPQRLKNSVRFDIEFFIKPKEKESTLLIVFVQSGSVSDKKFLIGDLIKSVNGTQVINRIEFDNEVNNVNWGEEVIFEVERKNKIEIVKIKTISFDNYKKKHAAWSLNLKEEKKQIKIESFGIEYNYGDYFAVGDLLLEVNSKKIKSIGEFNIEKSKYRVGDKIKLKIQRKNQPQPKIVEIKLINFEEAIKKNKESCDNFYFKKVGSLMYKEWVESDYGQNHDDWMKRREEIMELESIADKFSDARFSEILENADQIQNWKSKDIRLINKLVKPEYKDINFKLNFFSSIFNTKIITKLKSISLSKDCCYSFILTGRAMGGDWDKKVPANVTNFEKLISVKDKKKELLIDSVSNNELNLFFNLMIDKKKDLNIKYLSEKWGWFAIKKEKYASLSTESVNGMTGFECIPNLLENWFQVKYKFNNAKTKLAVDEWCKSFFLEYPDLTIERIKEIEKMDLNDEPELSEDDETGDDYSSYDDKIYISTSVNKKKINGKDSFVISLSSLPSDEKLQELQDSNNKNIYLKIYAYDVTDLDADKYYEVQDISEDTDQYFLNNCQVIKTEDLSWSEGNDILVQTKRLEPYGEIPSMLAFPYSKMLLPKYGKRKISFRSFICTEDQKFDENNGRFIFYENPCFRPDEYYFNPYDFDEYNDYSDILSYDSCEIEVEYKQPGYLEVNRRKYNELKIALSFALNQEDEKSLQENLKKIKDSIRYGDFTAEANIYKILNLKKNYERALNKKIKLDDILKELKKNSVIHERYEIIDFLLNLATNDETFSSKENKFIDTVSKELELNKEKYQEIKKQKTASVKFVDFGDEADESVFGINKDMSKDEKLKLLRKEYSRWNALTNNSDKLIRERAKEMRDLAASLRSEYNK